jgi:hypothetical protein
LFNTRTFPLFLEHDSNLEGVQRFLDRGLASERETNCDRAE